MRSIESRQFCCHIQENRMSFKRSTLAAALALLPYAAIAADPTLSTVVITGAKEESNANKV